MVEAYLNLPPLVPNLPLAGSLRLVTPALPIANILGALPTPLIRASPQTMGTLPMVKAKVNSASTGLTTVLKSQQNMHRAHRTQTKNGTIT